MSLGDTAVINIVMTYFIGRADPLPALGYEMNVVPGNRLTVGVPGFFAVVEAYLGSRTVQGSLCWSPVTARHACSPRRAMGATEGRLRYLLAAAVPVPPFRARR